MIIFLNGSINAGKSTVAKILVKELPNTALLEIDVLREMIDWMPLGDSIPINLDNAVSLIKNFSRRGIHVVVPYPLSKANYDFMISNLADLGEKIFVFTLAPRLDVALLNRGTRDINQSEKERIKHHYNIGIHNPGFGEVIDNTDQKPEDTARIIINRI